MGRGFARFPTGDVEQEVTTSYCPARGLLGFRRKLRYLRTPNLYGRLSFLLSFFGGEGGYAYG